MSQSVVIIGGGGFVGTFLCMKMIQEETSYHILVADVSCVKKLRGLIALNPSRIKFVPLDSDRKQALFQDSSIVINIVNNEDDRAEFVEELITMGSCNHFIHVQPDSTDNEKDLPTFAVNIGSRGIWFTQIRGRNWIGPYGGASTIIESCVNTLLNGDDLTIPYAPHGTINFCSIKDAVDAIMLVIKNPVIADGESFEVGDPRIHFSQKEFAGLLMKVYSNVYSYLSPKSIDGPVNQTEKQKIIDVDNISKRLGWKPAHDFEKLLELIISDIIKEKEDKGELYYMDRSYTPWFFLRGGNKLGYGGHINVHNCSDIKELEEELLDSVMALMWKSDIVRYGVDLYALGYVFHQFFYLDGRREAVNREIAEASWDDFKEMVERIYVKRFCFVQAD